MTSALKTCLPRELAIIKARTEALRKQRMELEERVLSAEAGIEENMRVLMSEQVEMKQILNSMLNPNDGNDNRLKVILHTLNNHKGRITHKAEQYTQVTNKPPIDVLQVDKMPLEILRNTAVQLMATTQLLSISEGASVHGITSHVNTDFESNQLPITALQVDKTPLDILRYQATQFVPLMALGALQDKFALLGTKLDASVDSANEQHPIALLPANTQAIEMLRHKVTDFEATKALVSTRDSLFAPQPKLVSPQAPIELLPTDTAPLEVLRNTAAQFMAMQLLSINEGVFVHGMTSHVNTDFESSHPPITALQTDETLLKFLKEQATQCATSTALCQLSPLLQRISCIRKSKRITPPQTLTKLTATPEPLQYLQEQGRALTEYNAFEWLSTYLQTLASPLRTRPLQPATLQKLEAQPELVRTLQNLTQEVNEYNALNMILQQFHLQVELHKTLKIQTEEAQRHNAQNSLLQLPFIDITDAFRTECENIVNGLLERARREQDDETNTREMSQEQETRQEDTYADEADTADNMPEMRM